MTSHSPELHAASAFLSSFFPSTPSPTARTFSTALVALLHHRYAQHWHPSDPERGSAYRAIARLGSSVDSVDSTVRSAALEAGVGGRELSQALLGSGPNGGLALGDRWTLWIDPGCVSLRIDRTESAGRDGQFLEIYGRLPSSLAGHAVPYGRHSLTLPRSISLNMDSQTTNPTEMDLLISPTKRSKAITITAPPPKPLSAMGALLASSPLPPHRLPALCSSPFVTPPTPLRPSSAAFESSSTDVFSSPSRSVSPAGLPLRSNSIGLGAPIARGRRSSSRASSCDEGSGSDGEFGGAASEAGSSIFSSESISSSVTSLGGLMAQSDYAGRHARTISGSEIKMDGEFKYPPIPTRTHSSQSYSSSSAFAGFTFPPHPHQHPQSMTHSRSSSFSGSYPPASPVKNAFSIPNSLPSSPTKPRRRGTRGAGSSSSHHEHSSSISSISSITSLHSNNGATPNLPVNPRTRAQALAGTLTEHSGGKVVVLGGGVLLGLAGNGARGDASGDAKRRGRERRGRGRSGPIGSGQNWDM